MAGKEKSTQTYKISDIAELTDLSADTLRYYEKISLLKPVSRFASGVRCYSEQDLSRIRFIQRAKTMNFSLDEIAKLLQMRENPGRAKKSVRKLTQEKLVQVEAHLKSLSTLQKELTLLINLCTGSKQGCPIIDDINQKPVNKKKAKKASNVKNIKGTLPFNALRKSHH